MGHRVALGVHRHIFATEIARHIARKRGHDVPRGATAADMIEG
ncbi:Uncharacterised protein [Raoultella planticola]|jgi:hypothetical protein|uniref:Uncharacterized protein n=1 Tax=Raoultella planticola TaxID=575 RepID=A0A485D231_RAOPL|nr:Uncharacterised protein [Raoultella planticola]